MGPVLRRFLFGDDPRLCRFPSPPIDLRLPRCNSNPSRAQLRTMVMAFSHSRTHSDRIVIFIRNPAATPTPYPPPKSTSACTKAFAILLRTYVDQPQPVPIRPQGRLRVASWSKFSFLQQPRRLEREYILK